MAVLNVTKQNTFDQFRQTTNTLAVGVGDASTLTTTATDAVGAVNELLTKVGDVSTLNPPAANLVAAINNAQTYAYRITLALG